MRPVHLALALVLASFGCGNKDVAEAQKAIERTTEKVADAAQDGVTKVGDGVEKVGDKVAEVVSGEEISDAKLVEQTKKSIKCKKEHCTMPRDLMDELLDRNELMSSQAKTYQLKRGEKTIGVEMQKLGPIPKALGFRSGDVLVEANGVELNSVQGAAQLYVEMQTAEKLEIKYRRGKKIRTKTLEFV